MIIIIITYEVVSSLRLVMGLFINVVGQLVYIFSPARERLCLLTEVNCPIESLGTLGAAKRFFSLVYMCLSFLSSLDV